MSVNGDRNPWPPIQQTNVLATVLPWLFTQPHKSHDSPLSHANPTILHSVMPVPRFSTQSCQAQWRVLACGCLGPNTWFGCSHNCILTLFYWMSTCDIDALDHHFTSSTFYSALARQQYWCNVVEFNSLTLVWNNEVVDFFQNKHPRIVD